MTNPSRSLRLLITLGSFLPAAALLAQRSHAQSTDLPLFRAEAFDFAFRAPTTAVAGFTRLRLVNRGPSPHHILFTKIGDTTSMAGVQKIITGGVVSPNVKDWGGTSITAAGDSTEAVVELKPGRYSLSCWIVGKDKKPHAMVGMLSLVDVKAASGTRAAEPVADLVLRSRDYHFEFDRAVTRGRHLVRFETDGPQEHDVQIVSLRPNDSMRKILKWANDGIVGAPPATLVGGSVGIDRGSRAWFPLDLAPGRYAMFCFVPDAKDGKPHILHGMWKEFTVR